MFYARANTRAIIEGEMMKAISLLAVLLLSLGLSLEGMKPSPSTHRVAESGSLDYSAVMMLNMRNSVLMARPQESVVFLEERKNRATTCAQIISNNQIISSEQRSILEAEIAVLNAYSRYEDPLTPLTIEQIYSLFIYNNFAYRNNPGYGTEDEYIPTSRKKVGDIGMLATSEGRQRLCNVFFLSLSGAIATIEIINKRSPSSTPPPQVSPGDVTPGPDVSPALSPSDFKQGPLPPPPFRESLPRSETATFVEE